MWRLLALPKVVVSMVASGDSKRGAINKPNCCRYCPLTLYAWSPMVFEAAANPEQRNLYRG